MPCETDEDRDDADEDSTGTQLDIITAVTEAAASLAVVYTRTEADSARESIEALLKHTEDLGYEYDESARKRLLHQLTTGKRAAGRTPENGYDGCVVIYDDDTHPTGVERLIEFVSGEYDVDDVVAESLGEFGAVDDVSRVVERLQDEGTTVHLVEDDLVIEPDDDRARRWTAATRRAARSDEGGTELVTEAINADGWTGRPPLGFTVAESGQLRRNERWDEIRNVVKTNDDGLITEYRASQLLDSSRDAIRNAKTKYRDLYRLDAPDIDATADAEQ